MNAKLALCEYLTPRRADLFLSAPSEVPHAAMRGLNSFLAARYIVFGLFTICNAITCSIAAWNFGLVHSTKPSHVDVYLIFLSAFSLFSIFTLIFVELLCINPFTTRVWFECAWVALFWIMELAGGAALIAIESDLPCSRQAVTFTDALCTSERVVLAFTWICTIMLLIYLLALVFIAASQHHEDLKIWVSDVRTLRAAAVRQCSSTTSYSPSSTRFKKRASVDIYSPYPVRSQPAQILHHYGGLSPEYKIEPFRSVFVAPEQMDIPYSSNLPEAIPLPPLAAVPIIPSTMKHIPALPQDTMNPRSVSLGLGLFDTPQELASSISYASPNLPSAPVPKQSNTLPSSSPLGDWPRQDVMKQPVKRKRKSPPPSAFEFPNSHMTTVASTDPPLDTITQPRPRRPSGPRLRVPSEESGHRPAALNLSGISNYETGRWDV